MIVYGHRGARGEAPENTLAGFRHAIDTGVRYLELDLQLSADKQIVVIHDTTTRRTMNQQGKVRAMSSAELAALRDPRTLNPWAYSTGVPTLEAVIQTCPEIEHFQFEVKSRYIGEHRHFCSMLIHALEHFGLGTRATVTSKDSGVLKAMRGLAPHVSRGYVAARRFPEPVRTALDLGCNYLVIDRQFVTRRVVRRANRHGLHVSVWTVNDLDEVTRMRRRQVDSIITDYPTAVRAHLRHLDLTEPPKAKIAPLNIPAMEVPRHTG